MSVKSEFTKKGWSKFCFDKNIFNWTKAVIPTCKKIEKNREHIQDWMRCGDTWFVGVNILDNDQQGRVSDGPILSGEIIKFIKKEILPGVNWDRGQLSIMYKGYPKITPGETVASFKFRLNRDAAHIDGLLPIGPDRHRMLREPHAFVLGVPLNVTDQNASPMVVWEESNIIIREYFVNLLSKYDVDEWGRTDLTQCYQEARRICFEKCERVIVHAVPGEADLVHRLTLHGVAPWTAKHSVTGEGRMICYFRPPLKDVSQWLM